ncbi:hypothetical protein G7046_g5703 [Stylonectria norvegica]|nr:hypothetical protein G7046_g5703 [Stylonectria norvegica]
MPHSHRRSYESESSSSRRHSKHHGRDSEPRRNSRPFDCCSSHSASAPRPTSTHSHRSAPEPRPAATYSSRSTSTRSSPSTYGTYIWPLDETRSVSRSHDESRYPAPQPSRTPLHDRQASSYNSSYPQDRRAPKGRTVIDVVDRSSSSLQREYGSRYPISLANTASIRSIVSFLAPNKHRAKVIVHWDDGYKEPLDDEVPLAELKKYGKYLEVKENKRVHWE